MPEKCLNFYTATYPFGWGESYIELESVYLSKAFKEINFYPLNDTSKYMRSLGSDFKIHKIVPELKGVKIREEIEVFQIMMYEFVYSKSKLKWIFQWRTNRALLKKAIRIANHLQYENNLKDCKHYSFWMNDWALALAVLKRRKCISSFCFRVNGFDIYDERSRAGYIPFRIFIYKHVSTIFTVSQAAQKYLEYKYKGLANFKTAYFGTKDYGVISKKSRSGELRILSCSRLISIKNVLKIADSLKNLSALNIHWMHHGEGEELEELKKNVRDFPSNIKFYHSGFIDNHEEAIQKQMNFAPDVFISLSASEGLPVTIINAISFGIPIIATDVGGCKEIVTDKTGILLTYPFEINQVRNAILEIASEKWQNNNKRLEIRNFWLQKFSAALCYSNFTDILVSSE